MRRLSVLFLCLVLCGCGTNKVMTFGKVNPGEKTALVPPGTYGVLGLLKETLNKNGWVVIVSRGDGTVRGTVGAEVDLQQSRQRSPHYNFIVHQRGYDLCLSGEDAVSYEIVVVDNGTGAEISSMKGNGCMDRNVGTELAKALEAL